MEKEQEQTQEPLELQEQEEQQAESAVKRQLEALMQDGEVTLTAESREDIYRISQEFVDSLPEGTKWTRPAVAFDPETGIYSQRYSLI